MTKPSWHAVTLIKVPAKPAGLWTPVDDYIIGPRLLRFQVVDADKDKNKVPTTWKLDAKTDCSADGLIDASAAVGLLLPVALRGALIGKIGGGSADLPELPTGAGLTAPIGTVYPGRRVFAVGSYCVIRISTDDSGQLFLTANDSPKELANHSGVLHVLVEEASV
jgi:hypothetical protein